MNAPIGPQVNPAQTLSARIRSGTPKLRVIAPAGTARAYIFSEALSAIPDACLLVFPERKEAQRFHQELSFFAGADESHGGELAARLHLFSPYDLTPLSGLSPDRELIAERIAALYGLMAEPGSVVVTSMEALAFRILPKEAFGRAIDLVAAGEELEREALLKRLEANGYLRTSLVEERGDYSVRGGVVDIFPPRQPYPVRLEFWGDRLESIREFDQLSQRSQRQLDDLVLLPANEIILSPQGVRRARSMGRLPSAGEPEARFPGQEAWLNHFYDQLGTPCDYLPREGLVVLFEPHRLRPAQERLAARFVQDRERFSLEAAEKGRPFPELQDVLIEQEALRELLDAHRQVEVGELDLGGERASGERLEISGGSRLEDELEIRLAGRGRVSLAPLAEKISAWLNSRGRVVLVSRTAQQAERLEKILANYEIETLQIVRRWPDVPSGPGLYLCLGRLSQGFGWPALGLYVVSEDEIFGAKRARSRTEKKARDGALAWSSFSQLKAGDLVVHEEHGIGRYSSLVNMAVEGRANDFLIVEYAQGDRLYIPADRIGVLQKYVGAEDSQAKLDRLGGRSWDIVKQKARRSVKRIARQLVELYALRKYRKGFAFSPPDHYFREFEASFEHEETPDQIKAVEDVLEDMAAEQPMDRLVCGDVGFGKTEVALRAAFKAVADGKQVALLVPTTVLAEQHFLTFRKRMEPYGVRTEILSRFKSRAEQAQVLARLRSGMVDVLIGTHRILQKDVKFPDLGLLIVDEEQRFGVKQKEALKKYRALVDVLAITATPIPRTFQMSLMGVRDLTVIETPPEDRLAIETYLAPYDEPLIARAIAQEVERGGQVFFVHNRVQTIATMADRLKQVAPAVRYGVAHGQMPEKDLEGTMMRFLNREIDVLVCSTIIESGLDIPSANTIIIHEVDRLGLAQIYQLRGRVGRSKEKAYAYLLISAGVTLTRDTEKRLKALMDFSHLGAGLHLAMHDLRIRGGGNVLGFAQAGHISAVGYELYLKLIEQAVAELKGEALEEEVDPEINLSVPAYLPGDYVIDTDVRLNLYRRLSNLRERWQLERLGEEIRDRFGPLRREVTNLLGVMSLRLLLRSLHVSRLDGDAAGVVLTFAADGRADPQRYVRLAAERPRDLQFLSQNRIRIRLDRLQPGESLPRIEAALQSLAAA